MRIYICQIIGSIQHPYEVDIITISILWKQTKLSNLSRFTVNNWRLYLVPPICQGKKKSTGKEIFVGRNILLNLFGMGEKDFTKMEITDVIEYAKNYNDLS